jgi:phage shock protein PspC (stress-responsive transcriptional regulator)
MVGMGSIWAIRRSATDAKLAGVCGGVARHWGVDPVLVRLGWALLALSGGIGLVLYLAGWLLVPVDGKQTSVLDDTFGRQTRTWPREVWVVVVVLACVISFAVFSPLLPFGLGPAAVLALIWYFGYYKNRRPAPPPPPSAAAPLSPTPPAAPYRYPGPATPFTEAAQVWQRRMSEQHLDSADTHQGTHPPAAAAPAAPDLEWPAMPSTSSDPALADPPTAEDVEHAAFLTVPDPVGLYAEHPGTSALPSRMTQAKSVPARRLRLVGVLVLGLVLAGMGVADRLGVDVTVTAYLAAALLVIGLTLIAATWLGRARGILPVGVLVLLALLAVSVAAPYGDPRTWARQQSYTQLAQLPTGGDRHQMGLLEVDLSRLEVTRDASYRAHVDMGSLQVTVPEDVQVQVRYQVDQGVVVVAGETLGSGPDVHGQQLLGAPSEDQPVLTLDLSVDHGEVQVDR